MCAYKGCKYISGLASHHRNHLKTCHNKSEDEILIECPVCEFSSSRIYLVKLHFKEMHKGENFDHEMAGEEVI
jgi:hypothetical protein